MSLLDKQLADELHCSVCWETMGEPVTLVCGHNICRGCLGELIDTAKQLGSIPGFSLLMLDTENKFVSTGLAKDIADAAQGRYFKLPKTNEAAIAELTQGAVGAMKA